MNKPTIHVKARSQDWDNRYQSLAWWKSDTIQQAKVMVVGAGALGNEVLKNLTLLNVGQILIVDYDHIEYSNLSRSVLFREEDCKKKSLKSEIAAKRIKEINSNVCVKYINGDVTIDVGLGVFRRMDVIIGCLDNRLARLFLNRASFKVGKTWIDGAIENLIGLVNVYQPPKTCYECSLTKKEWQNIKAKLGCPTVAKRNLTVGSIPTTPISSSIVAAIQSQEALKIICGNDDKVMLKTFYYEGMNNQVLQYTSYELKEDCDSHVYYDEIIEAPLSCNSSIAEVLDWLIVHFEDEEVFIKLENEVALKIVNVKTNNSYSVAIPKLKLSGEKIRPFQEKADDEIYIMKETDEIDSSFQYMDKKLSDIGIPALHIIQVYSEGELYLVELTNDEDFLNFV